MAKRKTDFDKAEFEEQVNAMSHYERYDEFQARGLSPSGFILVTKAHTEAAIPVPVTKSPALGELADTASKTILFELLVAPFTVSLLVK